MIKQRDSVLLGVSGGADSVCLFLILRHLSKTMGFNLRVISVEHGIRGEASREDARFVEKLCINYEIPCRIVYVDAPAEAKRLNMSLEEAARKLRYDIFFNETKEGDVIATAHHAGDNAETLLFNLIRGSGIRGLAGIAPVSVQKGRRIIRPLLCMERSDIELFLAGQNQSYRTDATNSELAADRNKIRHIIIPELEKINSAAVKHIAAAAMEVGDVLKEQEQEDEMRLERAVTFRGLDYRKLLFMQVSRQEHMIMNWLRDELPSMKDIGRTHVMALVKLLEGGVGRGVDLPGNIRVEKTYRELVIKQLGPVTGDEEEVETPVPPLGVGDSCQVSYAGMYLKLAVFSRTSLAGKEIPQKTYEKWFDYDKIKDNVMLRHRRTGDIISTVRGGHKRFKDYCIDEKIERDERDRILLVADGSDILWAVGYRSSEDYRVTPMTKRVLVITVERT